VAREARTALIGGFVVGAVALAVIAITVLGSGKFLQKRRPTFVMFFSGSMSGLSVGAPVEFRGVKVGEVTRIAAVFDPKDLRITIPVHVEFDPKSLIISTQGQESVARERERFYSNRFYQPLLEKGLKAQLDSRASSRGSSSSASTSIPRSRPSSSASTRGIRRSRRSPRCRSRSWRPCRSSPTRS
jgi:paraquat-inducible protein B